VDGVDSLCRYLLLRALFLCLRYRAYFGDVHCLPRRGTRARRTTVVVRAGFCLLLEYLPVVDPLCRRSLANLVRNEVQLRRAMVGRRPSRRGRFVAYPDFRWQWLDESHAILV